MNLPLIPALAVLAVTTSSLPAQFVLLDDMEGVDHWTTLQGAPGFAADPTNATNTVYRAMGHGTSALREQAYRSIPSIAEGTTGTLFFRLYTEDNGGLFDWVVGASDLAAPVAGFGSYDGYGRMGDGAVDVRNTGVVGSFSEVGPASSGTWYNIWFVLHNTPAGTDDTTDMYFNTSGDASGGGAASFIGGVFRNEATDLVSILVRNNESDPGVNAFIDDIYIDTTGENLSNPISTGDTDSDGMDDSWELTHFGNLERDGTGDFDNDELNDLGEFSLSTDPTDDDSDDDGFLDGAEVAAGSDPNKSGSTPSGPAGFLLVEDFEGAGMTVSQTFDGVNGWGADDSARALVQNDPGSGSRGQVGLLTSGTRNDVYKQLGAASIADGATGTLFFEVYAPGGTSGLNWNAGLSDQLTPDNYAAFEGQVRLLDEDIYPRDGGAFLDTGFDIAEGIWLQVWMVADNTSDVIDIYVSTPTGEVGQIQVANDYGFRNGTSGALESFLTMVTGSIDGYIDNIYVDPRGVNLAFPPIAAFEPLAADDSVEVGIDGAIRFNPLANDTGSIDATSVTVISGPSTGTVSVDPVTGEMVYRYTGSIAGSDAIRYEIANPGATSVSEADVHVSISGSLRLANTTINVPLVPPTSSAGALIIEDALPGLTFSSAVAMTSVPGTPEALLVASIDGRVWYIPDTTAANPTKHEVLDVSSLSNFTRNRSIYSIECYPNFATSGNIIVNYQGDSNRLPMNGGGFDTTVITGLDKNGAPDNTITCDLRVSRFTLSGAHIADAVANGMSAAENTAALDTEFPFINLAEQHLFHSINDAKFGADGYLYVSFGDEGDQGSPYRNDQKLTKDQFGAIIRIDVDPASTNPFPSAHYAIAVGPLVGESPSTRKHGFFTDPLTQTPNFRVPADNPFLHSSKGGTSGWAGNYNGVSLLGQLDDVRSEIWAFGLRNPFKIHLDVEDGTGDTEVWIGDVGKSDVEEFTILKKGENAGWAYWEGDLVTPGLAYTPDQPSGSTPHKDPLFAYRRGNGDRSATGGVFYRDTELSSLTDRYVCGDYASGRIWSIERNGTVTELTNLRLGGSDIVDFNVDQATKDIFVLEHSGSGRVMRITQQAAGVVEGYPLTLSETGIFADLKDLAPNPGVVPYSPNLKFWSDGADKSRWFVIKNLVDTVGYSEDGNWTFPEGMVFVKHFDYDLDQQNPGTNVKRLETRLLVRNASGSYGVSYVWNPAGTDANLVATEGMGFPVNFTNDQGGGENFTWQIPSRAECLTCHTPAAGHGLSLNTRQLNKPFTVSGQTGNQLDLFSSAGYLSGFAGSPGGLPRHFRPDETAEDLEARVRSYLAVNCAYCHQPGGGTPSSWDGREHLTIEQTNMLYGMPESEGTPDLTDHIVRPGDKANSSIWNKINARTALNGTFNGYSQMPPLASNRFDDEGIALIEQWIDNYANVAPTHVGVTAPSLPEGSVIGTSGGIADATDPDVRGAVADQSQLRYAITGGNPDSYFAIDPVTGEITVTGWLDHEETTTHILEVTASDNFAPNPMSKMSSVTVHVQDIVNEDADANGLPDTWEASFSLSGVTAESDGDSDGLREFFELLMGGDPTDSASPGTPSIAVVPASDPADATFSWRYINGFEVGTDYLIEGSSILSGWAALLEGVDYQVDSDVADGPGYRRMTIKLLSSADTYFLRLSSP